MDSLNLGTNYRVWRRGVNGTLGVCRMQVEVAHNRYRLGMKRNRIPRSFRLRIDSIDALIVIGIVPLSHTC